VTLQPSDSPDWSGIPGSLRFLGTMALAGIGNQTQVLPFTPTSYDGAIYVMFDASASGAGSTKALDVLNVDTGAFSLANQNWLPGDPPVAAPVARVLGPNWQVQLSALFPSVGGPYAVTAFVFAVPSFPLAVIQQPENPLNVNLAAVASVYVPGGPRQPYDSMLQDAAGAGVAASVTFPAVGAHRWLVDVAEWSFLTQAATSTTPSIAIVDGATNRFLTTLGVPATIGAQDKLVLGPGLGYVGSFGGAVTVAFLSPTPAGGLERVNAAAYQLAV
jgi:hypothetical protein